MFERIVPLNLPNEFKIQETYFANDLTDFLDGTIELYSNFLQELDPEKSYRLWTTLGSTFLNHDIVQKKYQYHFNNAKNSLSARSLVMDMFRE